MLFYGRWGAGAGFKEGMHTLLRQASLTPLFIGGLVGPVAACLCIIGFWHVRQNIVPLRPLLGRVVFYALATMMVAGGAVHALWVPRGLAIKYADTVGTASNSMQRSGSSVEALTSAGSPCTNNSAMNKTPNPYVGCQVWWARV